MDKEGGERLGETEHGSGEKREMRGKEKNFAESGKDLNDKEREEAERPDRIDKKKLKGQRKFRAENKTQGIDRGEGGNRRERKGR